LKNNKPGLMCRNQISVLKFNIAPVFSQLKVKIDVKLELNMPVVQKMKVSKLLVADYRAGLGGQRANF
jgi:hypothetical protein